MFFLLKYWKWELYKDKDNVLFYISKGYVKLIYFVCDFCLEKMVKLKIVEVSSS